MSEDRFVSEAPKGTKVEIDGKHYVANAEGELEEAEAPDTAHKYIVPSEEA